MRRSVIELVLFLAIISLVVTSAIAATSGRGYGAGSGGKKGGGGGGGGGKKGGGGGGSIVRPVPGGRSSNSPSMGLRWWHYLIGSYVAYSSFQFH